MPKKSKTNQINSGRSKIRKLKNYITDEITGRITDETTDRITDDSSDKKLIHYGGSVSVSDPNDPLNKNKKKYFDEHKEVADFEDKYMPYKNIGDVKIDVDGNETFTNFSNKLKKFINDNGSPDDLRLPNLRNVLQEFVEARTDGWFTAEQKNSLAFLQNNKYYEEIAEAIYGENKRKVTIFYYKLYLFNIDNDVRYFLDSNDENFDLELQFNTFVKDILGYFEGQAGQNTITQNYFKYLYKIFNVKVDNIFNIDGNNNHNLPYMEMFIPKLTKSVVSNVDFDQPLEGEEGEDITVGGAGSSKSLAAMNKLKKDIQELMNKPYFYNPNDTKPDKKIQMDKIKIDNLVNQIKKLLEDKRLTIEDKNDIWVTIIQPKLPFKVGCMNINSKFISLKKLCIEMYQFGPISGSAPIPNRSSIKLNLSLQPQPPQPSQPSPSSASASPALVRRSSSASPAPILTPSLSLSSSSPSNSRNSLTYSTNSSLSSITNPSSSSASRQTYIKPPSSTSSTLTTYDNSRIFPELLEKDFTSHWESVDNEKTTMYGFNSREIDGVEGIEGSEEFDIDSEEVQEYFYKCGDLQVFYINKHFEIFIILEEIKDLIDQNININEIIIELLDPEEIFINNGRKVKLKGMLTKLDELLKNQKAVMMNNEAEVTAGVTAGVTPGVTPVVTVTPGVTPGVTVTPVVTAGVNEDYNCIFDFDSNKDQSDRLLMLKNCNSNQGTRQAKNTKFNYKYNLDDKDDTIYQGFNLNKGNYEDIDINEIDFNSDNTYRILFGSKLNFNDYRFANENKPVKTYTGIITYKQKDYQFTCSIDKLIYDKKSIDIQVIKQEGTDTSTSIDINDVIISIPDLQQYYILFNTNYVIPGETIPKKYLDVSKLKPRQIIYSRLDTGSELMMTYTGESDNGLYAFKNILVNDNNDATKTDKNKITIPNYTTQQGLSEFLHNWYEYNTTTEIPPQQYRDPNQPPPIFQFVDFFVESIDAYLTLQTIKNIQMINDQSLRDILRTGPNGSLKDIIQNYKETIDGNGEYATEIHKVHTLKKEKGKKWNSFNVHNKLIDNDTHGLYFNTSDYERSSSSDPKKVQLAIYKCYDLQILYLIKHLELVELFKIRFYFYDMLIKKISILLLVLALYKKKTYNSKLSPINIVDVFEKLKRVDSKGNDGVKGLVKQQQQITNIGSQLSSQAGGSRKTSNPFRFLSVEGNNDGDNEEGNLGYVDINPNYKNSLPGKSEYLEISPEDNEDEKQRQEQEEQEENKRQRERERVKDEQLANIIDKKQELEYLSKKISESGRTEYETKVKELKIDAELFNLSDEKDKALKGKIPILNYLSRFSKEDALMSRQIAKNYGEIYKLSEKTERSELGSESLSKLRLVLSKEKFNKIKDKWENIEKLKFQFNKSLCIGEKLVDEKGKQVDSSSTCSLEGRKNAMTTILPDIINKQFDLFKEVKLYDTNILSEGYMTKLFSDRFLKLKPPTISGTMTDNMKVYKFFNIAQNVYKDNLDIKLKIEKLSSVGQTEVVPAAIESVSSVSSVSSVNNVSVSNKKKLLELLQKECELLKEFVEQIKKSSLIDNISDANNKLDRLVEQCNANISADLEKQKEIAEANRKAREEAARKEVARKEELARQELAKQELARQELARQELAKQELARQELARQELARQEAIRQQEEARLAKLEQDRLAALEAAKKPVIRTVGDLRTTPQYTEIIINLEEFSKALEDESKRATLMNDYDKDPNFDALLTLIEAYKKTKYHNEIAIQNKSNSDTLSEEQYNEYIEEFKNFNTNNVTNIGLVKAVISDFKETILGLARVIVRIKPLLGHNKTSKTSVDLSKGYSFKNYFGEVSEAAGGGGGGGGGDDNNMIGGYNYDGIIKVNDKDKTITISGECQKQIINANKTKAFGPFSAIYPPQYNNFHIYVNMFGENSLEYYDDRLKQGTQTYKNQIDKEPLLNDSSDSSDKRSFLPVSNDYQDLMSKISKGGTVVIFGFGFSGSGKTYALIQGSKREDLTKGGSNNFYDPSILEQFINQNSNSITSVDFLEIYPHGDFTDENIKIYCSNSKIGEFGGNVAKSEKVNNTDLKTYFGEIGRELNLLGIGFSDSAVGTFNLYDSIISTETQNLFEIIKTRIEILERHRIHKLRILATPNNNTSSRSFLQITINLRNGGKLILFDMPGTENTVRIKLEFFGSDKFGLIKTKSRAENHVKYIDDIRSSEDFSDVKVPRTKREIEKDIFTTDTLLKEEDTKLSKLLKISTENLSQSQLSDLKRLKESVPKLKNKKDELTKEKENILVNIEPTYNNVEGSAELKPYFKLFFDELNTGKLKTDESKTDHIFNYIKLQYSKLGKIFFIYSITKIKNIPTDDETINKALNEIFKYYILNTTDFSSKCGLSLTPKFISKLAMDLAIFLNGLDAKDFNELQTDEILYFLDNNKYKIIYDEFMKLLDKKIEKDSNDTDIHQYFSDTPNKNCKLEYKIGDPLTKEEQNDIEKIFGISVKDEAINNKFITPAELTKNNIEITINTTDGKKPLKPGDNKTKTVYFANPLVKYLILILSYIEAKTKGQQNNDKLKYRSSVFIMYKYIQFIVKQGSTIVTTLEHLKFFFLSKAKGLEEYNATHKGKFICSVEGGCKNLLESQENNENNSYIVDTSITYTPNPDDTEGDKSRASIRRQTESSKSKQKTPEIKSETITLKERVHFGSMKQFQLLSVLQRLSLFENDLNKLKQLSIGSKGENTLDLNTPIEPKTVIGEVVPGTKAKQAIFVMFTNIKIFRDDKDGDNKDIKTQEEPLKSNLSQICNAEFDTLEFAESISSKKKSSISSKPLVRKESKPNKSIEEQRFPLRSSLQKQSLVKRGGFIESNNKELHQKYKHKSTTYKATNKHNTHNTHNTHNINQKSFRKKSNKNLSSKQNKKSIFSRRTKKNI